MIKPSHIDKFSIDEAQIICESINENLKTIGFIKLSNSIGKYKRNYLLYSTLIVLLSYLLCLVSLWAFLIPILPFLIMGVLFYIDMNFVVFSMTKTQNFLMKKGIMIEWNDLMLFCYDFLSSDEFNSKN